MSTIATQPHDFAVSRPAGAPVVEEQRFVAAYIRLTRDESMKGLSASAQKENIESYASASHLGPVRIYEEPRAVGADMPFEQREAGRRLIADIKAGLISAVVVRDMDRLARTVTLWLQFEKLCATHGVVIHNLTGVLSSKSPSDRFATTVRAAAAQLEKEQVGDRVRRVKRAMAQHGRPVGGPPSFGYTSQARLRAELIARGASAPDADVRAQTELPQRGHLYVDDAEAKIVRLVFDWYVHRRWGCRRISNELNTRGYRRRSGLIWHAEKLRRIINDCVVAGFIPFDEQRFENARARRAPKHKQMLHKGKHEAIVPEAVWLRAQEIKAANTSHILGKGNASFGTRKYPFSGILRCRCGAKMFARSARRKFNYGYYICVKRKYHGDRVEAGGCAFPQLNTDKVHEALWAKLTELLTGSALVNRVHEAAQELQRNTATRAAEDAATGREAGNLRRQLESWSRRHADADPDSDQEREASEKIREVKRKFREFRSEVKPVEPAPTIGRQRVAEYLKSLGSLAASGEDRGKALVQSLVDHHGLEVHVKDDQTLHMSLRLRPPGADVDTVGEFSVELTGDARLPADKITAWVEAHQGKTVCACGCGRPVEIRRRHYWMGIPEFRSQCRYKGMARRRAQLSANLYTGAKVAKLLGIGRTTVNRWIKCGRLPKPQHSISKMLLFNPAQIEAIRAERNEHQN